MALDSKKLERMGGPGSQDLGQFMREMRAAVADLQTKLNAHTHTANDTAIIADQQSTTPVPEIE